MVAVVTGGGLGVFNSSRDVLGAGGQVGQGRLGVAGERITANAANGNVVVQDRDERLAGSGPGLELLRTYNAQGGWDGDNADGWRLGWYRRVHSLSGNVNTVGSTVLRTEADGHDSIYTYNSAAGLYVSTEGGGQYSTLSYAASSWTWTDLASGTQETYASADGGTTYRLNQVQDAEGRRIAVSYTGNQITQLARYAKNGSSAQQTLTLSYTGLLLSRVDASDTDSSGVVKTRSLTAYGYDATGRLSTVTTDLSPDDASTVDGNTYTVSYAYDAQGRLSSITHQDGSSQTLTYDAQGRIQTLTDDQGNKTQLSYDGASRVSTLTDARNQTSTLKYDGAGQLLEVSGAVMGGAAYKQTYTYNDAGDLIRSTDPAGRATDYSYDASGQGAWTRRTDAAGNVTERSYDEHGLLTAETVYTDADPDGAAGPQAPSGARTTRYIYDTAGGHRRLAYLLGPQGEITRYTYDSAGQLSRQDVFTADRYSGQATLAALDTWAGETQALNLAREVTEYTHDLRGQLSEERRYASEALVGGVVTAGDATSYNTVYDAHGRLLSRLDHDGHGDTYTYDGLDRLLTRTDAEGGLTVYSYDDAHRQTSVKLANGQTTVQTFDTAGRLVSSDVLGATSHTALGATQYSYDALGRLWREQDATGVSRYHLYDISGRKSADIAANGQLTEYLYDPAGQLIQRVAYANVLSAATLASLSSTTAVASVRPVASGEDRISSHWYDAAGRLTTTQDADGYLTRNTYDASSALLSQTWYAQAEAIVRLDASGGTTRAAGLAELTPSADAASDRTTRQLYDASGRLAARIDGEGALTLWTYDDAGHLTGELRRSVLLGAAEQAGTLAQLQALAPMADDAFIQSVYDAQGRLIARLDAEGALTEYHYDSAGRLQDTLRYLGQALQPVVLTPAKPATATAAAIPASVSLQRLQPGDLAGLRGKLGEPLHTRQSYNSRGLLEQETAPDGTVTRYGYDAQQRLVSIVRHADQADARTQGFTYDDHGRVKLSQVQGDASGIQTTYDAAGRRTRTTDAGGVQTVYYYDAQGRQIYAILLDPARGGEVTETVYSSFSEVSATVTHARRLSVANSASLTGGATNADLDAQVAALADATDNRTQLRYNRRGLIQQAIDALGATTDTAYNAFGDVRTVTQDIDLGAAPRRLITTTAYDRRGLQTQRSQAGASLSIGTQAQYDAFGRLQASTDERGQVTQYSYLRDTGGGRQVQISDAAGTSLTTYDALDRVVSRRDRNGNTVSWAYDVAARRMTVTTAEGLKTVTETNAFGEVVKVTDPAGSITTYAYDRHGLLTDVSGPQGQVSHSYDDGGHLTQTTSAVGTQTSTTYDAAGRVLQQTVDPTGLALTTRYSYDGQGRTLSITDPRGTVTSYSYNARGELTETVVDAAAGGLQLKTTTAYDAQGRVLSIVEGAGTAAARKTDYHYDELGRCDRVTVDPDGAKLQTRNEYDAAGHLLIQRNGQGELLQRNRYDAAGRLQDHIDATGAVTRSRYDGEGRLTATLQAARRLTPADLALAGDAAGDTQLAARIDALLDGSEHVSASLYDRDGRLTHQINGEGEVSRRRYDAAGRVIETLQYATRLSAPPTATSDIAALVAALPTAAADLHRYARYDSAGRQTWAVDATGAVTAWRYDAAGHVIGQTRYASRITLPLADASVPAVTADAQDRLDRYVVDAAGRERFHVDAENYVTESVYDDISGQTTTRRYAQRVGTALASREPLTLADFDTATVSGLGAAVATRVERDRAGRLAAQTDGAGSTTRTTYDAAGRIATVTSADGTALASTTRYGYDAAGRLSSLTRADGSAVAATTRYEYDARGLLSREIDARGVALAEGNSAWAQAERVRLGYAADLSVAPLSAAARQKLLDAYTTTYTHDAAGRLTGTTSPDAFDALGFKPAGAATTTTTTTEYDAFGNAVILTDARGYKRYQVHDRAGRLIQQIDAERYLSTRSYDAFGQLTATLRVDARVQGALSAGQAVVLYSAAPGTTPSGAYVVTNASQDHATSRSLDREGRLLQETDAENVAEGSSALDAFGQRTSLTSKLGASVSYTYDHLGRLLTETLPVQAPDAKGKLQDVVNTYSYDSRGNRIQSIEAQGLPEQRTTLLQYDGADRLVQRSGMAYDAYDSAGTKTTVTPVDTWRYDAAGHLVEQLVHGQISTTTQTTTKTAAGLTTTASVTTSGLTGTAGTTTTVSGGTTTTVTITTAITGGRRSLAWYDQLGRKTLEVSADRVATRWGYDAAGHAVLQTVYATRLADSVSLGTASEPSLTTDALNDRTLRTSYDAQGRKILVALDNLLAWDSGDGTQLVISGLTPQNTVLQRWFYDAEGHLTEQRDARGNASFSYYDGNGRKLLSLDAAGAATAWDYGRAGDVATRQTRYSGQLTAGYARQVSAAGQSSGDANDPQKLLATVQGLTSRVAADDRITEFTLDRLDRVTEQRVLNVVQDAIDASGKRTQASASAITTYSYNGLGALTQVRRLASQAGSAQTWEQTDISYDKLGRQTRQQGAAFTDWEGALVRPTTDTEYDALGRVSRRLLRGKDDSQEGDDRITRYAYDANGLLTQATDAAGAVTAYAYDATGNLTQRTAKDVRRSDLSTRRDLITRYEFDAAGRVTVQRRWESDKAAAVDLRKTRYNAFGEIEAQGVGDGWEEFAQYNTLGKVTKTNAGDGAIKFYLYDAAGNLTREIRGNGDTSVDLRAMTLQQASISNKLFSRVSVYDRRNQLVQTLDPQIDVLKSTVTMSEMYSQVWVPAWTPPGTQSANAWRTPAAGVSGSASASSPRLNFSSGSGYYLALTVGSGYYPLTDASYGGRFSLDLSALKPPAGQAARTYSYSYDVLPATPGASPYTVAKGSGQFSIDAQGNVNVLSNDADPYAMWGGEAYFINPGAATTWARYEVTAIEDGGASWVMNDPNAYYWGGSAVSILPRAPNPRDAQDVRAYTITYRNIDTQASGSYRVIVNNRTGTVSVGSPQADPLAMPVNFYIQGRNVSTAKLTVYGVERRLSGTYVPPANGQPGYTRFTVDARGYMGNGDPYKLQAMNSAGTQVLTDESGNPLVQTGRVLFGDAGTLPQVQQQITQLVTTDKVTIKRFQSFNAFGEVSEERDERVAERMLAAINDDRKAQGQTALTALTAEQLKAARTTLSYNTLGQLVAKTDPETFITAANGYRYRDRPVTRYGYDLLGRHTTTTDANGNLTRASYDAGSTDDDPAATFDAAGGTADTYNQNVSAGATTRYEHDIFGDVRKITDALGGITLQEHDALGRLVSVTRKAVTRSDLAGTTTTTADLTDSYTYDETGQRLRTTNALNQTATTDYDALGRIVKTVTAAGATTQISYTLKQAGDAAILAMDGAVKASTAGSATLTAATYSGGYQITTTGADGRSQSDERDYFGHTTRHTDLSGAVFTSRYNSAGQLARQTSTAHAGQTAGQSVSYTYYANGYIQSLKDDTLKTEADYAYDNAGNRVYEAYFQLDSQGGRSTSLGAAAYQNSTITYDELNRISRVRDDNLYDIRYEYDAMGNRRLVDSSYWDGAAGLRDRQTYWYAYDALNRFTVSKGQLQVLAKGSWGGTQGRGTSAADANYRIAAGTEGTLVGYLQSTTQNNALVATRQLDALGRTVKAKDWTNNQETQTDYDADHRLTQQRYFDGKDASKNYTLDYSYYDSSADTTASTTGKGSLAKVVMKPTATPASSTATVYSYDYWDSAQQKQITKVPVSGASGFTYLSYDANGHIQRNYDAVSGVDNRYTTTASGLVLQRDRSGAGTSHHYFYYADDQRIGDVADTPEDLQRVSYAEQLASKTAAKRRAYYREVADTDAGAASTADFDQNYEPINDNYPSQAASAYTVRSDKETLYSIAQAVWGDRSLWYLIAEANGLKANAVLKAGQLLSIPNKVTNIHNNSQTWRPYSAGEAIGPTDPVLPQHVLSAAEIMGLDPGGDLNAWEPDELLELAQTPDVPYSSDENPANWASGGGGDRMGDYDFIDTYDRYHDDPFVGTSPMNITYGRGLDAAMRGGSIGRSNTPIYDVRGANAGQAWKAERIKEAAVQAAPNAMASPYLLWGPGVRLGQSGAVDLVGVPGGETEVEDGNGMARMRPVLLASGEQIYTDAGPSFGAEIVSNDPYKPTAESQAFLTALTKSMKHPPSATGSRITLDDFGNPVADDYYADVERENHVLASRTKTITGISSSGVMTKDGGNYYLISRDQDGVGIYQRMDFSTASPVSDRAIASNNAGDAANVASATVRRGTLSERYETGGRGPGTVSGGVGDPGGVSYGSYQLASALGRPQEFLGQEGGAWAPRFAGMDPTVRNGDFGRTWQQIARESPDDFFDAQHEFIQRTHYDVAVARIQDRLGLDINTQPAAVQDVVWSTAVQHGPTNSVVERAYRSIPNVDPASQDFSERLINAIYDERGRTDVNGNLVYFSRSSADVQAGVARRFVNERADALRMLRGQ